MIKIICPSCKALVEIDRDRMVLPHGCPEDHGILTRSGIQRSVNFVAQKTEATKFYEWLKRRNSWVNY